MLKGFQRGEGHLNHLRMPRRGPFQGLPTIMDVVIPGFCPGLELVNAFGVTKAWLETALLFALLSVAAPRLFWLKDRARYGNRRVGSWCIAGKVLRQFN